MDETLTPQQHLLLLDRLAPPLMMIIASGLKQIGETRLAEISGQHIATCRKQLRLLADMGYLERRYRYNGYALLPKAYQAIPVIPPDREFSAGSFQKREYTALKPIEGENPAVPFPEQHISPSPIPAPDRENRVPCLSTPDRGFPAGSSQERENAANQPQNRGDSAGSSVVVVGIPSLINKRIPTSTTDSAGSKNEIIAGQARQAEAAASFKIALTLPLPVTAPNRENRVPCLPTPDRGFPAGSSQERENAANQPQNRGNSAVNRGITAVVPGGGGGGIYSLINKRIPPTTPDPPPDSGCSANAQIAGPTCQGKNRDWCGIFSNKPP